MSDDTIGKTSKGKLSKDWRRLRGMTDQEVHAAVVADPEIQPTDEDFWKAARVVMPLVKASHSDMRFKRAVTRICYESCWLYRYQIAIDRLQSVEAVGTDFFRVSLTALKDAQLIRLIRVLEDHQRVASFWYLQRFNPKLVNAVLSRNGLELNELQDIAGKLRTVRNKTFVHIDKLDVFDPERLYRAAGISVSQVAIISAQFWKVMREIYHLTHGSEFQHDEFKGDDIPILAKLRDDLEARRSSFSQPGRARASNTRGAP